MNEKDIIRMLFLEKEEDFYSSLKELPKYKEILEKKQVAEDTFLKDITREQFSLYDDIDVCKNKLNIINVEEAYIKGFTDATEYQEELFER